jgi:hypothetical protein
LFFEIVENVIWLSRLKLLLCDNKHPNGAMKLLIIKNFKVSRQKNYYVLYIDLVNYKSISRICLKIPVDKWIKNLNKYLAYTPPISLT